jgi:hypothetical protein
VRSCRRVFAFLVSSSTCERTNGLQAQCRFFVALPVSRNTVLPSGLLVACFPNGWQGALGYRCGKHLPPLWYLLDIPSLSGTSLVNGVSAGKAQTVFRAFPRLSLYTSLFVPGFCSRFLLPVLAGKSTTCLVQVSRHSGAYTMLIGFLNVLQSRNSFLCTRTSVRKE